MIKSISPSPLISPESVLHGLWKFFTQSFRECGGQKAGCCGYHPHNEDGGGQPVDLQQVQQEAEDAAYPGHQGAGPDCLVPDHCGEHLCRVHVDDGEACAGSELSDQRQEDLEERFD